MIECQNHDKVYANFVLLSNPPQYPWICKICGKEGVDRGHIQDDTEYNQLKAKKCKTSFLISKG